MSPPEARFRSGNHATTQEGAASPETHYDPPGAWTATGRGGPSWQFRNTVAETPQARSAPRWRPRRRRRGAAGDGRSVRRCRPGPIPQFPGGWPASTGESSVPRQGPRPRDGWRWQRPATGSRHRRRRAGRAAAPARHAPNWSPDAACEPAPASVRHANARQHRGWRRVGHRRQQPARGDAAGTAGRAGGRVPRGRGRHHGGTRRRPARTAAAPRPAAGRADGRRRSAAIQAGCVRRRAVRDAP